MNEAINHIRTLLARYPAAEWGPAHAVVSDYNLDDDYIEHALIELRTQPRSDEYAATITLLEQLLTIPEAARLIHEDD